MGVGGGEEEGHGGGGGGHGGTQEEGCLDLHGWVVCLVCGVLELEAVKRKGSSSSSLPELGRRGGGDRR